MNRRLVLLLAGAVLASVAPAQAQSASTEQTLQSVRRDLDELIRGQLQLQQQVTELKAMLQAAQPRPQNQFPTNFVFPLDGVAMQGNTNAAVTMVEISDVECPFCAAYATETFPWIEHDYIKTDKVRYGLVSFPLAMHRHARAAAAAVECAGQQGKLWEMRDSLIASQNNLSAETFLNAAARLGLQTNAFAACLLAADATNRVNANVAAATHAGVTGTPTFFFGYTAPGQSQFTVQKVIVGQRPFEEFKAVLDTLLAGQPAP